MKKNIDFFTHLQEKLPLNSSSSYKHLLDCLGILYTIVIEIFFKYTDSQFNEPKSNTTQESSENIDVWTTGIRTELAN